MRTEVVKTASHMPAEGERGKRTSQRYIELIIYSLLVWTDVIFFFNVSSYENIRESYMQILFSQLSAYAFNMRAFGATNEVHTLFPSDIYSYPIVNTSRLRHAS